MGEYNMVRVPLRKPTVATLTCSACRENIYGNFAVGLFGLTENHGSGYNQSLGPTNATGTPQIKNMLIKDVVLTETMGPAVVFSLAEAPIKNFTLQNISWSMHKGVRGGYQCTGWKGTKQVTGLFATGQAIDVTPPLPAQGCGFLGPPAGAAVTAPPMTTPPPCSLNGVGSPCVCDEGWTGVNCGQLDLLPAPPLASQVTALSATTTSNAAANSTWGISVVGPDKAGLYHGYMTEIANHCPLGDYGVASQVAHMTATHPLGPWSRKGIALKGFVSLRPPCCVSSTRPQRQRCAQAHNPQAVMAPNGSILLFHIGKELEPNCLKNCATDTPTSPGAQCPRLSHAASVAVADSFDGPWTRYPYILGSRPTNPAPFICEPSPSLSPASPIKPF